MVKLTNLVDIYLLENRYSLLLGKEYLLHSIISGAPLLIDIVSNFANIHTISIVC